MSGDDVPAAIREVVERGIAPEDAGALDLALELACSQGETRRLALLALGASRDPRALDVMIDALEHVPAIALIRCAQPAVGERVRAVLVATGVTEFVPRTWPTLAQYHASSDLAKTRSPEAPAPPRIANAIRVLGARGEALDLLVPMFEGHPDRGVRFACAHALAAANDPRAHAAIDARWSDAESVIAQICVRAAVFRDLPTLWQRFLPPIQAVLDRRSETPDDETVVAQLLYVCHGGVWPRTMDPDPVIVEPRLLDLAARLRRHERLGGQARRLLEVAPRSAAIAAIERYPYTPPLLARVAAPSPRDWLARYVAGEHAVWDEIVGHALAIAQHPELRDEAYAVAVELMKRVRRNVDCVRANLELATGEDESPATEADLAPFVEKFGPLPVALEAFWRTVGSIDLGPATPYTYEPAELESIELLPLDPLVVDGAGRLPWALREWTEHAEKTHPEIAGPIDLAFAPDFLHKQNISGGPPYSIELPPPALADAIDPRVDYERHRLRFVGYLRMALRWGGFPLLADVPNSERVLARLRKDLVEF